MKRTLIFVLVATMILPACAPTLATVGPGSADVWRRFAERVPAGSAVKIRTTPGERFTAVLLAVDDTGIEVSPKTRIPEPIRRVRFDQIARLEMDRRGNATLAKAAAIGAGVGAGTFLGLLLLITAMWDD